MRLAGLLCWLTLHLSAASFTSLIPFADDAPAAWLSGDAHLRPSQDARGLLFPLRFDQEGRRILLERRGAWDLNEAHGIRLRLEVDQAERILEGTLSLRSGNGWYSGAFTTHRDGVNSIHIPKSAFRAEGRPAGWDRIDAIRFSFWPRGTGSTLLRPLSLEAVRADLMIVSGEARARDGDERYLSRVTLWHLQRILDGLGLPYGVAAADALATLPAGGVILLPYNPNLTPADVEQLARRVRSGSKLIVWENASGALAALLGVAPGETRSSQSVGLYDQLRFQEAGFPGKVFQHAWQFQEIRALPGARILARWGNAQGELSNIPALSLHANGAWFVSSWRSGDIPAKQEVMLTLLEALSPRTLRPAADFLMERVADLPAPLSGPAARMKEQADQEQLRAGEALRRGAVTEALRALRRRDSLRQRALSTSVPPWSPSMAGIWDQQGTGFYAGGWDETARLLREAGFTAVFPNLSSAGRAHYASKLLPGSKTMERHGDQLQQVSAAARKHGLELHVWKICWQLKQPDPAVRERLRRDGRLMRDDQGRDLNWLSFSHPENVQFEIDTLLEIARSAPIDGLHLDYMRYPGREADYGPAARRSFEQRRGQAVANWPADVLGPLREEFQRFRQDELHRAVERIHQAVKAEFPRIVLSAAVWGAWPDCAVAQGQDWPVWARRGWVDLLMPMNYTDNPHQFSGWLKLQARQPGVAERLVPGIGVISTNAELSPEETLDQLRRIRAANARGFMVYRLDTSLPERLFPYLRPGLR